MNRDKKFFETSYNLNIESIIENLRALDIKSEREQNKRIYKDTIEGIEFAAHLERRYNNASN